jgi:hypothetical protein
LQDTDTILGHFYKTCFDLGTECSLVHGSEDSWVVLKARADKALAALAKTPIALDTDSGTFLFDDGDLALILFAGVFQAEFLFNFAVEVLHAVLRGDRELLKLAILILVPSLRESCPPCGAGTLEDYLPPLLRPRSPDAKVMISCADSADPSGLEISDWKEYFLQHRNDSSMFGPIWSK